uniref:Alpha-galactosidase n=1 Tax=Plectus sambesii TaxID=2011161 RepID=A0A914WD53_9BILA
MLFSAALLLVGCLGSTVGLENGLARTPPMGWMSWTIFWCQIDCIKYPGKCINERMYKDMADRLVEDGYKDFGYNRVHIDDCWMEMKRDKTGTLIADRDRFPSGIQALSRYMHAKGILLGIYEDYGNKTCGGYPGSQYYLEKDANTFAEWEVDYLKLDGCYAEEDDMAIGYPAMSDFLKKTGRDIVYSCSWPAYLEDEPEKVDYNVIGKYCNLWRNYGDISAKWSSIQKIIDYYTENQDKLIPAAGPGRWHDPDMIVVGQNTVTPDQSRTQMSLWSIWSAPLIMSNDLRVIKPVYKKILQNSLVIAVDQDPLGIMGRMIFNNSDFAVYLKPITPVDTDKNLYSYAVVFFNRNTDRSSVVSIMYGQLGLNNPLGYFVQDLWENQYLGLKRSVDVYVATIPPTGVKMIKATLAHKFFIDTPTA